MLHQIASSLTKNGLHEKAGELFQQASAYKEAMEAYRQGAAFRKAVELSRAAFPGEVVKLEEQWGDHLCSIRQYDTAIIPYVEAGLVVQYIVIQDPTIF